MVSLLSCCWSLPKEEESIFSPSNGIVTACKVVAKSHPVILPSNCSDVFNIVDRYIGEFGDEWVKINQKLDAKERKVLLVALLHHKSDLTKYVGIQSLTGSRRFNDHGMREIIKNYWYLPLRDACPVVSTVKVRDYIRDHHKKEPYVLILSNSNQHYSTLYVKPDKLTKTTCIHMDSRGTHGHGELVLSQLPDDWDKVFIEPSPKSQNIHGKLYKIQSDCENCTMFALHFAKVCIKYPKVVEQIIQNKVETLKDSVFGIDVKHIPWRLYLPMQSLRKITAFSKQLSSDDCRLFTKKIQKYMRHDKYLKKQINTRAECIGLRAENMLFAMVFGKKTEI